jgi:hypothetical protein
MVGIFLSEKLGIFAAMWHSNPEGYTFYNNIKSEYLLDNMIIT